MWLSVAVGLLFLFGALSNVFGADGDPLEAVVGATIGAALIGIFFLDRAQRRRDEDFARWIIANREAILRGEARHGTRRLTAASELIRFSAALSFLLISLKLSSRLYVRGEESAWRVGIAYSLVSLIFGWWGIPWGPVYTVQALTSNIRGGQRHSLRNLLSGASAAPPTSTA